MTGAATLGRVRPLEPARGVQRPGQEVLRRLRPHHLHHPGGHRLRPGHRQRPRPFKVTRKDGKWVIPSHYDYPADAKQRLVNTATGVIGLVKDSIRSDRVEDQEAFGVIDPLDTKAQQPQGDRQAGHAQGRLRQGPGRLHHRQGGQGPPRPALRPGPRPEADLRRERQGRPLDPVRRLDRDQPAEARRRPGPQGRHRPQGVRPRPPAARSPARSSPSSARTPRPPGPSTACPTGKEPNTETLLALSNALGDLKIAGIRPKPEGLTADLKEAPGEVKPTPPRPPGCRWSTRGSTSTQATACTRTRGGHRRDRRGGDLHPPLRRGRLRHRQRALGRDRADQGRQGPGQGHREGDQGGRGDLRRPLPVRHRHLRPGPDPAPQALRPTTTTSSPTTPSPTSRRREADSSPRARPPRRRPRSSRPSATSRSPRARSGPRS